MSLNLQKTFKNLSSGWIYRGEGNANIVLSLPKTHKILRIAKCNKPKTLLEWLLHWLKYIFYWDYEKYSDNNIQMNFYNLIMVSLFGIDYVHPATSISISKKEIQKLNKEVLPYRPAYRRHKTLQFGKAALFIDYAFLPKKLDIRNNRNSIYAIELKPKQGWIHPSERNNKKCQFCLNQFLKAKEHKIEKISSYCPLNLFSGDKYRMIHALKSLIKNPQNNFKLFKDGIYYYGEHVSDQVFYTLLFEIFGDTNQDRDSMIDRFCELLQQSMLIVLSKPGCEICDSNVEVMPSENTLYNSVVENTCAFTNAMLPSGCVLEKILSLQKLNKLGVQTYYNVRKGLDNNINKINEWSYVCKLLKTDKNGSCLQCVIKSYSEELQNILKYGGKYSELHLVPYLISAIADDCSFMITFKKHFRTNSSHLDRIVKVRNTNFLINIGVFDLYPKPLSTIEKHVKRNAKLQYLYEHCVRTP